MSSFARGRTQWALRPLAIAGMALLTLTIFLVTPQPAAAHGSAIDPPSRHYGCASRWDDVGFNGSLAPGASTTFGFLGKWLGANGDPAISCAATR